MLIHLGLSTGRVGSGLCWTRIRPDQIGWTNFQPVADREDDRFGRVKTPTSGGWVRVEVKIWKIEEIWQENDENRPKSSEILQEIAKILTRSGDISPDLAKNSTRSSEISPD